MQLFTHARWRHSSQGLHAVIGERTALENQVLFSNGDFHSTFENEGEIIGRLALYMKEVMMCCKLITATSRVLVGR